MEDRVRDEMAWQKLRLAKVTICLGKIVFSTPRGRCVPAVCWFAHRSSRWVPVAQSQIRVSRKFLIFVWLGCCDSVFFAHSGPCYCELLVASQLNCCNMLVFGLRLQSIQEL